MDCDRFSIELNVSVPKSCLSQHMLTPSIVPILNKLQIYGYLKDQAITFHQISLLATAVPALDKSQETGGNGQLPVTVLV
jgi:hypothetical protein